MEEDLMELGFTKNEAKVYVALTELGTCTATRIAEQCKLHRTNVYESLGKLIEKGLIAFFDKGGTKFYEVTNPENILNIIKLKEAKAMELIPRLKVRDKLTNKEGFATIIKGVSPFVSTLHNLLDYKEPIKVYGIPKDAVEMMKTQIPHFHKARLKKKVEMFHIYNYDAIDRVKILNGMLHTYAKYIDDEFKSSASTLVCADEVIISLWLNPVFSVRIVNPQIANSYRHYFDILWKDAVKP